MRSSQGGLGCAINLTLLTVFADFSAHYHLESVQLSSGTVALNYIFLSQYLLVMFVYGSSSVVYLNSISFETVCSAVCTLIVVTACQLFPTFISLSTVHSEHVKRKFVKISLKY